MRLVNHEFEEKLSEVLFQTVVVPFRSEIYGFLDERTEDGENDRRGAAVVLQDKGMRVFRGFGQHIRRFAISFEVDYAALSKPPTKSYQEAITTFWGIYRWPFSRYNRYSQIEGLEKTADETRTMTEAFKHIKNAQELGLSIDSGLGWLQGPDMNSKDENRRGQVPVFGLSRFSQEGNPRYSFLRRPHHHSGLVEPELISDAYFDSELYNTLQRMLAEAGYQGEDLQQSMRTLLQSEGLVTDVDDSLSSFALSAQKHPNPRDPVSRRTNIELVREIPHTRRSLLPGGDSVIEGEVFEITETSTELADLFPLKGEKLTKAQKEVLLEVEWAQRAFIQSYAIAIIDNTVTFRNVTTFTIARLSSRHVNVLRRDDFWAGLPGLETLSLAVIPDWREVSKLPTSRIEDIRLEPSQALPAVFHLLHEHIASRESIKSLHFEWLCGGEEAMGMFARNQLILAAPFVAQALDMVATVGQPPAVLRLPHVHDLSLKNCWTSSHIFNGFVDGHKMQSLNTLILNSVSLCADCPAGFEPQPAASRARQHLNPNVYPPAPLLPLLPAVIQGVQIASTMVQQHPQVIAQHPLGQAPTVLAVQAETPVGLLAWLDQPRVSSWTHVIDNITPSLTLSHLRHSHGLESEPPPFKATKLKQIVFESCGYIKLPLNLDQSMLETPRPATADDLGVSKRRADLVMHMMKVPEHTLGTVVPYMPASEISTLHLAWGLFDGWSSARFAALASLAVADGFQDPGRGRFYGSISASAHSTTSF
ncbi:MAG: hypothetical protein M1818_004696 [Claussenomyces sp. TS43310]|nr:MAG: hypothetical protein M1818_004696 [Claussenomyces sp. TS43310]